LQDRSTTKVTPYLSREEFDRREEKGRRKARMRKHKKRKSEHGERQHFSPLALEARAIEVGYRETLDCPIVTDESTKVPGEVKQNDEAFIYGLADPRDHAVRYIGKTQRALRERLHEHEFKPSNRAVGEWLKEMRSQKVRAEIVVLEVCKAFRWQEREIHWIAKLRKEHGLLNIAKGGRFYGPPKGKPAARASQAFHRRAIARSGPVRHLSPEEIAAIYGKTALRE
jgi:hypothetical protein